MAISDEHSRTRWRPQVMYGDRLRVLRRDFGIINGTRYSQMDFAKLLSVPGGTYAAWEANTIRPPYPVSERIAEITGCDPNWLDEDEPPGRDRRSKRSIRPARRATLQYGSRFGDKAPTPIRARSGATDTENLDPVLSAA